MRLLLLLPALFLTGCAGANLKQVNTAMAPKAQAEFAAWDHLTANGPGRCAGGKDPGALNNREALAFAKCMDGYVDAEIAPIAMYPDLLGQFRLARAKSRRELSEGKITWEETRLQSGVDWNAYVAAVDARVRQVQTQAYQTDVAQAQRMAIVGNALQAQSQQQELHDAMVNAYEAQTLTTHRNAVPQTYRTTCRKIGDSVNCSTR